MTQKGQEGHGGPEDRGNASETGGMGRLKRSSRIRRSL